MSKQMFLKNRERFFLALGDATRLRILNLLSEGEVCVCFFTETLQESQPKISRHLAYLRGADLVSTRRDGKWVYYRINWPLEEDLNKTLRDILSGLSANPLLAAEKRRLGEIAGSGLVKIERGRRRASGTVGRNLEKKKLPAVSASGSGQDAQKESEEPFMEESLDTFLL
jgi:ArsR family transcriptional regulator